MRSLPSAVEDELRRRKYKKSFQGILAAAAEVELELERLGVKTSQPLSTMAADLEMEEGEVAPEKKERWVLGVRTPGHCFGCGVEKEHFYKTCPYKDARCQSCACLGHISRVCPNHATKDSQGRVNMLVKNSPGATTVKQRKDQHKKDQIETASDVLAKLKDWAVRRATKSTEARKEKQKKEGWTPKRTQVEHPVLAAEEELGDKGNETEDSDDELLQILSAFGADIAGNDGAFQTNVEVNGF